VLREGPDAPPPILFLRGAWRPEDARAVALVGTRAPTDDGRRAAFLLGSDLGAAGFTVVSGLAVGVDAEAHAGALDAGGRTLAVIGCGLDIDYPPANRELRARIESEDRGAVISEHPPGTLPKQMYFPRRNRLISALSRAIVVVEAGEKSGALITADQARRQNKVLFAAPGSPFNPQARGNHALLRAGAALAASAEDIVAVLEGAPDQRARRARPVQPALPKSKVAAPAKKTARAARAPEVLPADPVLRLWSGDEACGLDALAARAVAGNLWPAERAGAALLESLLVLEMKGQVERLPGSAFRIVGNR
jgi:DNA processing protein